MALILAIAAFSLGPTKHPGAASAAEAEAATAAPWQPPRRWHQAAMVTAPSDAEQASGANFIHEVRVDRKDVCPQEPITVEVDASDTRSPRRGLRITIGQAGGSRAKVRFLAPGDHRLVIRATSDDGLEDSRELHFAVHDCGGAFQYVAVATEAAAQLDAFRFVPTPFFDKLECAQMTSPDGGPASRVDVAKCNATPGQGETLVYHWDFGDGSRTSTGEPYAEHSYADRPQPEVQSNFIVKVDVESSEYGTISGFTNVLLTNTSTANKLRAGVITPTITLGEQQGSGKDALAWSAVARNPERVPLTLEDVEVTLTGCSGEEASKSFQVRAGEVLDDTELAPGTTNTVAHLTAADVGERFCYASFKASGSSPEGYAVSALFGTRLRDDGAVTFGADTKEPELKKRYERTMRALQILGRGLDGGPATVTDDEIRALELQGKLD
jgi:hypothetical protein